MTLCSLDSCQEHGTTEAIFLVRQNLGKKKKLYFAFADLEKAFKRGGGGWGLQEVVWWAINTLGVKERLVKLCRRMQEVMLDSMVKVGVHQVLVLCPLLFIMILVVCVWIRVSTGIVDDLVLIAESMEELIEKWEKKQKKSSGRRTCRKGVGSKQVQKRCSGMKGRLRSD